MPEIVALYSPPAGHLVETLAGTIETDAQFATQPVAGDQIVYPDDLAVDAQLNISGPSGTYTLWHVRQAGVVVATTYEVVNVGDPVLSAQVIDQISGVGFRFRVQTDKGTGTLYVRVSSSAVPDEDIVTLGAQVTVTTAGVYEYVFTGGNPSTLYYLKAQHVDSEDNASNIISMQQSTYASGSISAPVVVRLPDTYTLATLDADFDNYLFADWPNGEPDAGWQLITLTEDGYFDDLGNYYSDVEQSHPFWVVEPDGTTTRQVIDTEGTPFAIVGTLTLGTPVVGTNSASLPFTWSGTVLTGYQYRINSGPWVAFSASPAIVSGLTPGTAYTYSIRPMVNSVAGTAVSGSFTTGAVADITTPVIVLAGGSTVNHPLDQTWIDPGYTATDAEDGNLTANVFVSGMVNINQVGAYVITYTVADEAGNQGQAQRVVFVVGTGALTIDSLPVQILRGAAFNIVVSDAAVTPTPGNSTVVYAGQTLPVTSVSPGAAPWTLAVSGVPSLAAIQQSYAGYPLTVSVGTESVQSANIPFLMSNPASRWVNLTSVATGPRTIGSHFSQFALQAGYQVVYLFGPANVQFINDTNISQSGVITYTGVTPPTVPMQYRVITDDGVLSDLNFISLDFVPPTITLNGLAVQSVPQNATWTDPGATAVDNNGDILTDQIVVTGSVNTATLGQQILTYTVTDAAGNSASVERRVYVYAASTSYTDPREVVRVVKANNLVFIHDGSSVPVSSPKDPNSRIFKGFELLGFASDEVILGCIILIDGVPVNPDDTVSGLTYHGWQSNGINKVKVELSGGTLDRWYELTIRYTTQYTPSDDRSQKFTVMEL